MQIFFLIELRSLIRRPREMKKAEHSRFGALYKKDFLSMFILIICVFSTLSDFFQLRIGGGSCYRRDGMGITAGTTVAVE